MALGKTLVPTAIVVLGLVLAGGSLTSLWLDTPSPVGFGSVDRHAPTSVPAAGAWVLPATAGASMSASKSPTHKVTPLPAEWGRPTRLQIPSLGISAAVEDVNSHNGSLGVPDDVNHVGWWSGSGLPGSASGTTVIDGHVDSATHGTGALFHLVDLKAGQLITLTTRAGADVTYRVYGRRVYSKTAPLPGSLFTTTGTARLVLITCGGPFDSSEHSYQDNIVVFAQPIRER